MTRNNRDGALRRAFAELREEDRRTLPPFDRLLARAPAGADGWRGARRRATVTGLAAIAVAAALYLALPRPVLPPRPETAVASAATLAAWRPPTEVLLRAPGGELVNEQPRFGAFDLPGLDVAEARPKDAGEPPLSRRKEIRR